VYAVDLHNHTRFFHGFGRAAAVYDPLGYTLHAIAGRLRGLDGLALTNHDYYRPFVGAGVTAIPGVEVSTTDGHVLVVGPNPPATTTPGTLTPEETIDLAHERGCAAIIAHPFRDSSVRDSDATFDAVEINGKHPHTWERVRSLAAERDLPIVGGSDAHFPIEVGRAYTLIDADELTPESVAAAVRDGRVDWGTTSDPTSKVVHRAYRYVHGRKGHWEDWPPGEHTPSPAEVGGPADAVDTVGTADVSDAAEGTGGDDSGLEGGDSRPDGGA